MYSQTKELECTYTSNTDTLDLFYCGTSFDRFHLANYSIESHKLPIYKIAVTSAWPDNAPNYLVVSITCDTENVTETTKEDLIDFINLLFDVLECLRANVDFVVADSAIENMSLYYLADLLENHGSIVWIENTTFGFVLL